MGVSRWHRLAIVVVCPAVALLVSRVGTPAPRDMARIVVERGRGPVPASYVGLHIHRAAAGTAWPSAPFAAWRLWDAYAVWPWLEPRRGDWQWQILDSLIDLAAAHRVEVLMPLGLSPTWASARRVEPSAYGPGFAAEPANLDDWRRHVEAVVSRYRGRVSQFEIWNEPNLVRFYSGNVETMIQLCRAAYSVIKRIDPAAVVVSPSATGSDGVRWLDRFLAAGGADCFDVVGFHFYVWPDAPEAIVPLAAKVHDVLRAHGVADRPLWNTETGWYVERARPGAGDKERPGALSETGAAEVVARALVLARAAGVARFYWYAWDNGEMGLADRDGRPRAPAAAFAEIAHWLVGAVLDGCRRSSDAVWTCELSRDGRAQWIVWSSDGRRELANPLRAGGARRRDLAGTTRSIAAGTPMIEISSAPQLLEADTP
jgi:Glycosyl hydrolase catalytic core